MGGIWLSHVFAVLWPLLVLLEGLALYRQFSPTGAAGIGMPAVMHLPVVYGLLHSVLVWWRGRVEEALLVLALAALCLDWLAR